MPAKKNKKTKATKAFTQAIHAYNIYADNDCGGKDKWSVRNEGDPDSEDETEKTVEVTAPCGQIASLSRELWIQLRMAIDNCFDVE